MLKSLLPVPLVVDMIDVDTWKDERGLRKTKSEWLPRYFQI